MKVVWGKKRFWTAVLLTAATVMLCPTASARSAAVTAINKGSLSEYTSSRISQSRLTANERLLFGFDSLPDASNGSVVDTSDSTQGSGSLRSTLGSDMSYTAFRLSNRFSVNAADKSRVTFKMDIWVNDMSLLKCDHEAGYPDNDYSHSGTLYWRLTSSGGTHCINTTISDKDGSACWQTIEFSLLHDNGCDKNFNYSNITGSWLMFIGKKGLVVRVDNLRVCTYSTSAVSDWAGFPQGSRVVSTCDADALDGAVISEWYGSSFDFTHKKSGSSCLKFTSKPEDDYRVFFGGCNMKIYYATDYICFWLWVEKNADISGWFLEANQVQDSIEYENAGSSFTNIKSHAVNGFRYGEWNLIQLPLTSLVKHNAGDSITMNHLRMVPYSGSRGYTAYIDSIYVCNAAQAAEAARNLTSEASSSQMTSSLPQSTVVSAASDSPVSGETDLSDRSSVSENPDEVTSTAAESRYASENAGVSERPASQGEKGNADGFPAWGWVVTGTAAVLVGAAVLILLMRRRNKA